MKEIKSNSLSFKNQRIYIEGEMFLNPCNFETVEGLINEIAPLYIVSESGHGNTVLMSIVWAFDEGEAVENALCVELENVCSIQQIKINQS